jgi:hypothetical protein
MVGSGLWNPNTCFPALKSVFKKTMEKAGFLVVQFGAIMSFSYLLHYA